MSVDKDGNEIRRALDVDDEARGRPLQAPVVPDTAAPVCKTCNDEGMVEEDVRLFAFPKITPCPDCSPPAAYPSEKARKLVSLDDVRKLAQHFGSFLNTGRPMTASRKARWVASRKALDDALVSVFAQLAAMQKDTERFRMKAKTPRIDASTPCTCVRVNGLHAKPCAWFYVDHPEITDSLAENPQ